MMSSKAFIFLGLLFAIAAVLSSEVAARDLQTAEATAETNGVVEDVKGRSYDNGHGHYGGSYGSGRRSGHYGGGYPRRGHYGGGGHCHHGCCGYHGSCSRCCSYAGEAVDAQPQAKPQN